MKIKSIKVIKGKNKWSESKDKLIHMVLDLGEYEQKPSNKIEGFYERIKKYLPSMQSHRCSIGKAGGFFKRVKEGTWMGHIIEHVALELQTLAGYDTGWGRTRGVKGEKGVYNVVFNYEDEDKGKLAAKEAVNVVKDIINDKNPQIDKIVKKLKTKPLKESIRRILREIEEDRVQIRLGRNAERHFGTVQNIIISLDGEDITSEDDVPGLGKMNIVIKDGEIIVGDVFIPEKYRRKGIATIVYQKISDYFELPIVSSTIKGFNQTKEGGYIWKNKDNFKPRNLQESIRRILREERNKYEMFIIRRFNIIDKILKEELKDQEPCYWKDKYKDKDPEYGLQLYWSVVVRAVAERTLVGFPEYYNWDEDEEYRIYGDLLHTIKTMFGQEIEEYYNNEDCSTYYNYKTYNTPG